MMTLVAIMDGTNMAENLPFGPAAESSSLGGGTFGPDSTTPYVCTDCFTDVTDTWLQTFACDGSTVVMSIEYKFPTMKTFKEQVLDCMDNGPTVAFTVTGSAVNDAPVHLSGALYLSDKGSYWATQDSRSSRFMKDDGIWGARNGEVNGDVPSATCATKQAGFYGFGNCNSNDASNDNKLFNGRGYVEPLDCPELLVHLYAGIPIHPPPAPPAAPSPPEPPPLTPLVYVCTDQATWSYAQFSNVPCAEVHGYCSYEGIKRQCPNKCMEPHHDTQPDACEYACSTGYSTCTDTFHAPIPPPAFPPSPPAAPPAGCSDTDDGATDPYGDDCEDYAGSPSWCGGYDSASFSSNEMCCACGGGTAGMKSEEQEANARVRELQEIKAKQKAMEEAAHKQKAEEDKEAAKQAVMDLSDLD
jgi:hypothetical protein